VQSAHGFGVFQPYRVLLAAVSALVLVLYGSILKGLVSDWWQDPDYTHGFLVPVFVAYVLWRERNRYKTTQLVPSNFGMVFMLVAIAFLVGGTLGADSFTSRISLCVLIAGMVLYLCGWSMLRALSFPLAYLMLMIPLPLLIYNQVTFPLQLSASRIAAALIEQIGIPVFREGNILSVPHYRVEVAVACSGIRSLLSLIALGIAYGYIAERRTWVRVALVVSMVPIGIFTNALRIAITSLLGYSLGPSWAEGFMHLFSGWLIFLVALGFVFFTHALLTRAANIRAGTN
jgi:exosortase